MDSTLLAINYQYATELSKIVQNPEVTFFCTKKACLQKKIL